jgi:alpha-mannosidase
MADRGKHHFAYALYPHKGDWTEAGTVRRGYEFNTPPLALFLDSHQGELPSSLSFFKASPQNIILASMKKSEDRDSLILRLYEAEGRDTEARIMLFGSPKELYELDLMENRLRTLSVEGKELKIGFGQSEIKTIELVY